jgi:hypothetical protein
MTAGHRSAPARLALAALVVLLVLPACGRKGAPVAPERRVPQPVGDLRGVVREDTIALSWTLPQRRMDNTRLTDPGVARLFRAEDGGAGEPRAAMLVNNRVAGYTEVASLPLADGPAAQVQGRRVTVIDRQNLTRGRRYTYVVVTSDARGRTSPPSPRTTLTFAAAPAPPADLRVESGDREARLSWRPPTQLADGGAVSGPLVYEILRAPSAEAPLTAIGRTAPGVTTAADRAVENDRTYRYAVRAIRQEGTTVVEGAPTAAVAVTPADVTPPASPADLVAIPSERTVRLSWTPSPDADVAAYVVYRGRVGAALERVGSVRVPGTTFTDRDVPPGPWRYGVTAQDTSARGNESRPSNEVRVTVP